MLCNKGVITCSKSPSHLELNFIQIQGLRRPRERESPSHLELNFIQIQGLRRRRERKSPSHLELNFIQIQGLRRPRERKSPSHLKLNFIQIQGLRRPREREKIISKLFELIGDRLCFLPAVRMPLLKKLLHLKKTALMISQ